MMTNQMIKEAILTLGISMAPPFGITITIHPDHNVGSNRKYSTLRPIEQYHWLRTYYFPRVILPFVNRGIAVPELHKDGRIHLHCMCWDKEVINEIGMADLRACVNNTVAVNTIIRTRKCHPKVVNHIHFFEKKPVDQWIMYMCKDQLKYTRMPAFFPFIFNDWSPELSLEDMADFITEYDIDDDRLAQKRAQQLAPAGFKKTEVRYGTGDFQLLIY